MSEVKYDVLTKLAVVVGVASVLVFDRFPHEFWLSIGLALASGALGLGTFIWNRFHPPAEQPGDLGVSCNVNKEIQIVPKSELGTPLNSVAMQYAAGVAIHPTRFRFYGGSVMLVDVEHDWAQVERVWESKLRIGHVELDQFVSVNCVQAGLERGLTTGDLVGEAVEIANRLSSNRYEIILGAGQITIRPVGLGSKATVSESKAAENAQEQLPMDWNIATSLVN